MMCQVASHLYLAAPRTLRRTRHELRAASHRFPSKGRVRRSVASMWQADQKASWCEAQQRRLTSRNRQAEMMVWRVAVTGMCWGSQVLQAGSPEARAIATVGRASALMLRSEERGVENQLRNRGFCRSTGGESGS